MGAEIFGLVLLWVLGTLATVLGGIAVATKEGDGGIFLWLGGMLIMGAIWQSWVIYKFFMLPLGL